MFLIIVSNQSTTVVSSPSNGVFHMDGFVVEDSIQAREQHTSMGNAKVQGDRVQT